jgi:hypothetical protein
MPHEATAPAPLEILSKKWPFPTRLVFPAAGVTVLTTQTQLLTGNPNRVAWMIINLAANRGFLWFMQAVSTSLGIPIEADGDIWSADVEEDGALVVYPVFAILQNASGTMIAIEVVREATQEERG